MLLCFVYERGMRSSSVHLQANFIGGWNSRREFPDIDFLDICIPVTFPDYSRTSWMPVEWLAVGNCKIVFYCDPIEYTKCMEMLAVLYC